MRSFSRFPHSCAGSSLRLRGRHRRHAHRLHAVRQAARRISTTRARATSEAGLYRATIRPQGDTIPQGKLQRWTLHLETAAGAPVDSATSPWTAGCRSTATACRRSRASRAQLGNGDHLVEGMKFNMGGWWVVKFRVDAAAGRDSRRVQPQALSIDACAATSPCIAIAARAGAARSCSRSSSIAALVAPAQPTVDGGRSARRCARSRSRASSRCRADPSNRYADDPRAAALGPRAVLRHAAERERQGVVRDCHVPDAGLPGRHAARRTAWARRRGARCRWPARRTARGCSGTAAPTASGRRRSVRSRARWSTAATARSTRTSIAEHYRARVRGGVRRAAGARRAAAQRRPGRRHGVARGVDAHARRRGRTTSAACTPTSARRSPRTSGASSSAPSRFDRYVDAELAGRAHTRRRRFSATRSAGLRLFIGKANCVNCHNGALLTDDHFHNTGVPASRVGRAPRQRARGRRAPGARRRVQLHEPVQRREAGRLRGAALRRRPRATELRARVQDAVAAQRGRPRAVHARRPARDARARWSRTTTARRGARSATAS